MAAAETARLIASLELQDKNFTRGIRNVERGVGRVDKKLGAFSGFVNRNVGRALDNAALKLTQFVGTGLEELAQLEDGTTSVTGAISQVGKGWSTTADDIATWANEIEADTEAAFDDKAIVASAATLIRYGKVSEDNLRPALEVMTDLAAKTGDTESAATLLGKSLADPAKAAGKLARQGIILTKAQQKQIKAMVKAGDTAGAQTLLLDILSKTTEGAARASAGPYRDALNKLGDAGEDLRRSFAIGLLPVIEEVSDVLTTELAKPETLETLKGIGKGLAETLKTIITTAKQLPWKQIGEGLSIAATAAKGILDAFLAMPAWVQTLLIGGVVANKLTGGLVKDLASGLIKGVLGINAGIVNVNGPVAGGAGGAAGAAGGASKFSNAVRILGAVSIAGASLIALAEVFRGFQETVTESQQDLLEKVNQTSEQGFTETIANLKATNAGIQKMNPLENVLAGIFGGSEIVKNFEMATSRIDAAFQAGELSRDEMITAIGALEETLRLNPEVKLPGTESLLKQLIAAVNKNRQGPDKPEKRPRVSGVGDRPSPGNPGEFKKNLDKIGFEKWVAKASEIKNAVTTASSAQQAELGNIKNASATLNTTTATGLSTIGGNITTASAAAGSAARNIAGTASRGLSNTTSAARQAGFTASAAAAQGASRIVGAINALDLSVNVTTVNRTSTINNRYGPSGGSSTTQRAGGNTG